jgi:hypothetical protein
VDGEVGAAHKQLTHTHNLLNVHVRFHWGTTRILGTKTVIYNSNISKYFLRRISILSLLSHSRQFYLMSLFSLTHTPEFSRPINCIGKTVYFYKKSSTRTYLVLTVFESSSLRV